MLSQVEEPKKNLLLVFESNDNYKQNSKNYK